MYVYFDHDLTAETPNNPDGGWPGWTDGARPSGSLARIYPGSPNFGSIVDPTASGVTILQRTISSSDHELVLTLTYLSSDATAYLQGRSGGYRIELTRTGVSLYGAGLLGTSAWTCPTEWGSSQPGSANIHLSISGSAIKAKAYGIASGDPGWLVTASDSSTTSGTVVSLGVSSNTGVTGEISASRVQATDGAAIDVHAVTESLAGSDSPAGRALNQTPESLTLSDAQVNARRSITESLAFAEIANNLQLTNGYSGPESLAISDSALWHDLTAYDFSPPSLPGPRAGGRLFRRINIPYGVGLFKIGGFYRQVEHPGDEHYETATEIYLGGHEYAVDGDTAAALTAAGYAEYLHAHLS